MAANGSDSRSCNAGYQPSGEFCLPCIAGTYKNTIGNTSCDNCPTGFSSPMASKPCPNLLLTSGLTSTIFSETTFSTMSTSVSDESQWKENEKKDSNIRLTIIVVAAIASGFIFAVIYSLKTKKTEKAKRNLAATAHDSLFQTTSVGNFRTVQFYRRPCNSQERQIANLSLSAANAVAANILQYHQSFTPLSNSSSRIIGISQTEGISFPPSETNVTNISTNLFNVSQTKGMYPNGMTTTIYDTVVSGHSAYRTRANLWESKTY